MVLSESSLDGVRVLVVDDQADDCDLYRVLFETCGATTTVAQSAHETLTRVEMIVPDVVISDIGLPDADGYALIRALRDRGVSAPAVAVTGFARAQDRESAFAAGFAAYLVKPVEPEALVATVAALVGRERTARGATSGP